MEYSGVDVLVQLATDHWWWHRCVNNTAPGAHSFLTIHANFVLKIELRPRLNNEMQSDLSRCLFDYLLFGFACLSAQARVRQPICELAEGNVRLGLELRGHTFSIHN